MFYFISFLKGHAKIIDEYLSDSRASFHGTVVQDKIRFHDNNDPDPDWMVKQCYLLITTGAMEILTGVSNFWKSGPSRGRQTYPDFCLAHLFAGVTKSIEMRTPEISLGTFFHLA